LINKTSTAIIENHFIGDVFIQKLLTFYLAGYEVEGRRKKSQEVMTIKPVGM